MRHLARFGLVGLSAVALAATALAQAPPAGKAAGQETKKADSTRAALLGQTLATVKGHKITRADVIDYLSHYRFPENLNEQQVYDTAINALVNTELLTQFLDSQK